MKHDITYRNVPRETYEQAKKHIAENREKIDEYISQLLWWNNKISLISRTISRQKLQEHIIHSILPILLLQIRGSLPNQIIDCGTGGGLPGIPIAICFPGIHVMANDISTKKIFAVKHMARQLDIENISFLQSDVRALNVEKNSTIFSKHAFKIDFLVNTLQDLNIDHFIFYKGGEVKEELEDIDLNVHITQYNLTSIQKEFYSSKVIVQLDTDYE